MHKYFYFVNSERCAQRIEGKQFFLRQEISYPPWSGLTSHMCCHGYKNNECIPTPKISNLNCMKFKIRIFQGYQSLGTKSNPERDKKAIVNLKLREEHKGGKYCVLPMLYINKIMRVVGGERIMMDSLHVFFVFFKVLIQFINSSISYFIKIMHATFFFKHCSYILICQIFLY